ncbi:hypothetical protein DW062_00835 [Clostridium sp. AF43-10]|nr:hypothetical protein DW062_00835 [Clostridium sp. AF43-10]
MISFVVVILIKILKIIKNSPTISRDIVRNWVKIENKKKSPSEIEESAENDGENFEICKKFPMADKYVGNDLGKCLNYPKIPQYWKL